MNIIYRDGIGIGVYSFSKGNRKSIIHSTDEDEDCSFSWSKRYLYKSYNNYLDHSNIMGVNFSVNYSKILYGLRLKKYINDTVRDILE
jgi:nitrate/TMAO reductase-like tetraheme cytochrome c subunit